ETLRPLLNTKLPKLTSSYAAPLDTLRRVRCSNYIRAFDQLILPRGLSFLFRLRIFRVRNLQFDITGELAGRVDVIAGEMVSFANPFHLFVSFFLRWFGERMLSKLDGAFRKVVQALTLVHGLWVKHKSVLLGWLFGLPFCRLVRLRIYRSDWLFRLV